MNLKTLVKELTAFLAVLGLTIAVAAMIMPGRASANTNGLKWNHKAGQWPYITVQNDVPYNTTYPVWAAVDAWGVPLHYARCNANTTACVKVVAQNKGYWNNQLGRAEISYWPNTGRIVSVTLVVNTYFASRGRMVYWQMLKHELGHAMGLDHDNRDGVMLAGVNGLHQDILPYHRAELRRIYDLD